MTFEEKKVKLCKLYDQYTDLNTSMTLVEDSIGDIIDSFTVEEKLAWDLWLQGELNLNKEE